MELVGWLVSLTPLSSVIRVVQLVKKLSAFFATRMFVSSPGAIAFSNVYVKLRRKNCALQ
jgi:hypothetical protein